MIVSTLARWPSDPSPIHFLLLDTAPAISEPGKILDLFEAVVDIAKLPADTSDERAHVGAVSLRAGAGGEPAAAHEIVKLAVADVPAVALDEIGYDGVFAAAEPDAPTLPVGPVGFGVESEVAMTDER